MATPAFERLGAPAPSDREFLLFQRLIRDHSGISLSGAKRALLAGRLASRLRELGLRSFSDYYALVVSGGGERQRMLDRIATNETRFFREPQQFEFLTGRLFPAWRAEALAGRRQRRVRVWSAACSTGEEPYSLAMTLLAEFPPDSGWSIEILASDLSTRALERARAAVWPMQRAHEIPDAMRRAFMLRSRRAVDQKLKAGPEIRELVRFEQINLNSEGGPAGRFDVIFCRNVLIYFDAETKARVLARLFGRLEQDGHLFLGHAESLTGLQGYARAVGPNVYPHPQAARQG
jgi:chemotaxis protein methyltransferase CheR